jgi:hypothetical protein
MNYSNKAFYKLMDDAAASGAEHLDKDCTARTYVVDTGQREYEHDDGDLRTFNPNGAPQHVTLPACSQSALFSVGYEGPDRDMGPLAMTICAVDDALGAWPKYGADLPKRLARMEQRELFFVSGDTLEKDDPRVLGH